MGELLAIQNKTAPYIIASVMLLTLLTANFVELASADASSSLPITWNQFLEGPVNYSVSSLVQTSDGGYSIAGSINSGIAFLIKTHDNGSVEWGKTYEGLGYVHVGSMVQTSDGGYVLGGGTASNDVTTSSYDLFFWLVKTDSEGNQQWNKTYGQPTTGGVYSVIQTSDDGYALAGSVIYGNRDEPVALLVKTDDSGNMKWNQTYSDSDWAHAKSVVQANDGGYVFVGTTNPQKQFAHNYWLVKTDAEGSVKWTKKYNYSDYPAEAIAIVRTSNGRYTLAGYIGGFGPMYIWVINVDQNGSMLWNSTWPEKPQPMSPNSLTQTNDGGYVVTGYASSLRGFNGLQSYLFIFKLSSDGKLQWQMTYSTLDDGNSALYAIQTKDGNYVLAGTMLSNTTGLETVWFAKVDLKGIVTAPLTNQTLILQPAQSLSTETGLLQFLLVKAWYVWVIVSAVALGILVVGIRYKYLKKQKSIDATAKISSNEN